MFCMSGSRMAHSLKLLYEIVQALEVLQPLACSLACALATGGYFQTGQSSARVDRLPGKCILIGFLACSTLSAPAECHNVLFACVWHCLSLARSKQPLQL